MAYKKFILDNGQVIYISKKKNNRSLKLSITPHSVVRVSIPAWAPYKAGLEFAKTKQQWISSQIIPESILIQGQQIGKAHRIVFDKKNTDKISSRVTSGEIRIAYPDYLLETDKNVQNKAKQASIRALRKESEALLPQRLKTLSDIHNFEYRSVAIKQLRGRWGSCDSQKRIVLNLFLIQLPWDLIDYVLIHELVHTQVMKHGPSFWKSMENINPKARDISKQLKRYQPVVGIQQ